MAAAKAAGEAPVLPRMIQVVMRVVRAGIVTYPRLAVVDVRSVGMPFLLAKVPVFLGSSGSLDPCRTVRRNILMAASDFAGERLRETALLLLREKMLNRP